MAWGTMIAIYLFLAGLSAGAFVTAFYVSRKYPEKKALVTAGRYLAPVLLAIGLLLLIVDAEAGLKHPLRFIYLFVNWGSMMTIGTAILSVFIMITFFVALLNFLKKAIPAWLEYIGVAFAVGTAMYTGFLIGVVNTVPLWNTSILPILFAVSAASTGMAITVFTGLLMDRTAMNGTVQMKRIHFWLIAIEILLLFTMFYITSSVSTVASESVRSLLSGEFSMLFWGGLMIVGLIIPLAVEGMELMKHRKESVEISAGGAASASGSAMTMLIELFVLAGGFILRYLILAAAIAVTII
ncbi:NrfD/PsrC family molybdoenzyme membrane anchor subunit [Rubeoparvulum massiliense]|uniref:NrfD/PsrC family molybdoenzyme membrane anchor subunit n=1 Tax=Rubeoparvulum massiliense TaxID=1631346 RepID=UPI00065DE5B6|nr:NrfD/PsrC family molybdoenzyme membrane anchor subunit [Rubeoparvulum massiliense]